jgi:hypothetical protein
MGVRRERIRGLVAVSPAFGARVTRFVLAPDSLAHLVQADGAGSLPGGPHRINDAKLVIYEDPTAEAQDVLALGFARGQELQLAGGDTLARDIMLAHGADDGLVGPKRTAISWRGRLKKREAPGGKRLGSSSNAVIPWVWPAGREAPSG